MSYHVFCDNAYDATNYIGEFTKDELASLLRQTGYDRLDRAGLTVIEGRELSRAEIDSLAS